MGALKGKCRDAVSEICVERFFDDINPFEAIADVIEWENAAFGEVTLNPEDINAEKIVNLYVIIKGEELLSEYDLDQDVSELLKNLEGDLNE